MISIDHLSFDFVMDDERFAQGLYADWDSFCRTCLENIVEECLSVYDRDRVLHEIEMLDLDLGSIPQEDFRSEFPRRLREELMKALPYLPSAPADGKEATTAEARLANLLYYLEYGIQKTEWTDMDFDLSRELESVAGPDKSCLEKIAGLCMANEYVLRRILLQTDHAAVLVRLYSIAMDRTFSVKDGKRRFMEIFLEIQPDVPMRFIHETEEDGRLHGMAELLGTRSVRKIMEEEAGEHAEVDLPPYWHYLYEWLIKYYPYNGVAIFGGKSDFISHLHYRLLTFVRKRNHTLYLSKPELTAAFLLEVFGATYYKEVLNAIYNMQPRNVDGSPASDGYYNLQLYRVFMQLSLLAFSSGMNISGDETADGIVSVEKTVSSLTDFSRKDVSAFLKDARRSDADKRMLIAIMVRQKPEAFISWLKSKVTDNDELIAISARLMDERTWKRLLASTSLAAMETVDGVVRYLTGLVKDNRLADGLSHESFSFAFRKAVLLWIKGNDYALPGYEKSKYLLQWMNKEISGTTGKNDETTVEEWMNELCLSENKAEAFESFDMKDNEEIKESIRQLGMLLAAGNISETVKRRLVVSFLERYKDNYEDVIEELYEQGVLTSAISRISVSATESVIRRMVVRHIGTEEAEKLLLLIDRLFAEGNAVSAYLQDSSLTLSVQVLVWLAKEVKVQAGIASPFPILSSLFLTALFGKENVSAVTKWLLYGMAGDITADGMKEDETLELMELLSYTGDFRMRHAMSMFEQWSQHIKVHSNTVQTLLESDWNTSDGFMEWLEDAEVTAESKRELLQALAREKPQELIVILRKLPQNEEAVSFMSTCIPIEMLSGVVEKVDAKQALLLSRTVDWLQKERGRFAFLSHTNLSFTTALSEAFLLFMQDEDTLRGRNLTEQEVVGKFLEHLYYVYTRRTDYNDNKEWKHLQDEVTDELGLGGKDTTALPASEDATSERLLAEYSRLNDAELYQLVAGVLDKEPEAFVAMLENNSDTEFIRCISHAADKAMLRRMITVLSSVSGLGNPTAFIKLMEWLGIRSADRISATDMMNALLLWTGTTDWKRQSIRQMTVFFLSHLYGSEDATGLPLEMLTDDALPEEVRKRLLRGYMRSRPTELLSYIQRLAAQGRLPLDKWTEWTELSEWLCLAASVSLTLEELLRQVVGYLEQSKLADEATLTYGVATYLAENDAVKFAYYVDKMEVTHSFVLSLPVIQNITENKKEEIMSNMLESLGITPEEERVLESSQEDELEVTLVGNAGLCLLSPWFPRLFFLLGYQDEERRNFKDTASRIRAVFLLQYLVNPEEKDYREPELAFNRLLVTLPAQVPLPKRVELTDGEKEMADNMLASIKSNWSRMDGTSVNGFRQSFIQRDGRLEQQDEKWLLTIESRAYDILLDTIPWAFRQIRFPWLKKYIQVSWHEKQRF
ncbi:contractile injection system tape measure protein [Phocaeicola faecalis]|uniref:contractile injection system tape measure protein n=1 Tax=Phocaeicola faecalis TaxID=2786956 RepID=UPI001EED9FDB|nr:contractile injection system tape measure protein [Phocaeicola faecalis]